jgi:hypothetical protein
MEPISRRFTSIIAQRPWSRFSRLYHNALDIDAAALAVEWRALREDDGPGLKSGPFSLSRIFERAARPTGQQRPPGGNERRACRSMES